MVTTNKDQVCITEISQVQNRIHFFIYFYFIYPVLPILFIGRILMKKGSQYNYSMENLT